MTDAKLVGFDMTMPIAEAGHEDDSKEDGFLEQLLSLLREGTNEGDLV